MSDEQANPGPKQFSAEYLRGYRHGFRDALRKVKPDEQTVIAAPAAPASVLPQFPDPSSSNSASSVTKHKSLIGKLSSKSA